MTGLEVLDRHHDPLQPRQRGAQPVPRELQLAAVMRLQAHHAVGERVVALVEQQLQPQEFARRLAHLAAALDEEVIVHPDLGARMRRHVEPAAAAEGLVLRDFVGVVDLAVVDPAGVDVEGEAEQLLAHNRAFEMPAGRALAPRAIPFHLPRFARRGLAPDREIGGVAFARDRVDPALAFLGHRTRKAAVIRDGRDIEIEPAVEFVAMPVGNALREVDHLADIIGRHRPFGRLADVERFHIGPEGLGIVLRNVPDRLRLGGSHLLHLVLARIAVIGQMADIGDVDDVGEVVALPAQRTAQHVGEDIGAHIADMGVVVDRRPAGIDARFALVDGGEFLQLAGERVEQLERRIGHSAPHIGLPAHRKPYKTH